MKNFVVCMDELWIRDAEMFNTAGLTDDELSEIDMHSSEHEDRWNEMEPTAFVTIVKAENENEACEMAASQLRYDRRCLFAIEVK